VSPPGPARNSVVDRLTMLLVPALVGRAIVRVQGPFAAEPSASRSDRGMLLRLFASQRTIQGCVPGTCLVSESWAIVLQPYRIVAADPMKDSV
jgi:hypothetical protein